MSELKQERTTLESMTLELKDLRLNMKTTQMAYDKKLEERKNYINISTIDDIEYLYTREIENSSIVWELLSLLLNNGECGTIKPTIFEDLIQIIDNVCAIYSKSIIVLVNDYIKKDEAENMKQDQRD